MPKLRGGGGGGGGPPGSNLVGPSDVVFVDPTYGNDATGARGNAAKPFLTVRAAVAAMTTPGDMVSVAPGVYDETAGGGTITAPLAVTRWGIVGWGRASSDEAGNPQGTLIKHTTADLFTLRPTDTGFSFQNITLQASGALKRAIVADGTGGGGTTMTAGLVGTDATLLAPAGFFFQNLGIVDMRDIEVNNTSAAQMLTCSRARLTDVLLAQDFTVSWNQADGSKPAAGRVAYVFQSLRVTGTLTLDRQVKVLGDAGCRVANLVGGANLVVNGGLALSQVWDGAKFGTYQGADGLVDFSTNPIPDFAGLIPNGFFGCQFLGTGLITFDTPGVNRQRVSMDNSTIDGDNVPKTLHTGRAMDFDATNLSLGPAVLLTSDPSASFGQRLGIVNAVQNFFGGQRIGDKKITTATGAYTTLDGDYLLLVDTSTGAIADITLISDGGGPTNVGRTYIFLDMGGNASGNPFNVLAPGGGSINGAASVTVNQNYGGLVVFTFDGVNYFTPACCGSISGAFSLVGDISPTQLTADVNNYAPTALNTAVGIRLTSNALWHVTGLTGGTAGRLMFVENVNAVGGFPIVLSNLSASSAAANRFTLDADLVLMPGQSVLLRYDITSTAWRVVSTTGSASSPIVNYATKTTNYTILTTDSVLGADTAAGSFTFTVPQVGLTAGGAQKLASIFKRTQDTNGLTIARGGGFAGKINGDSADLYLQHSTEATYPGWDIFFDGTDIWVLRRQTQEPFTQVSALSPSLQQKKDLDLLYGGQFTRAGLQGAVQFRAARTDGLPWITMTQMQTNVRRTCDFGDGNGLRLRMEPAGSNLLTFSTDWTNAAWTKTGVTVTAFAVASPDEGEFGTQLTYAAVATNETLQTFATGATHTGSVWLRCAAGTENIRLVLLDRTGAETTAAVTVTTTWTRYRVTYAAVGAGIGTPSFKIRNGADGLARTVYAWQAQVEASTFATSEILTDTAVASRSAELVTYNYGAYPGSFNVTGAQIVLYCELSSAELTNGGVAAGMTVIGDGAGAEYIMLSYAGAQANVYLFTSGAFKFVQPVSWNRGDKLTINFNPSTGALTLAGFSAGNGAFAAAAWVGLYRALEIGTRTGGGSPMWADFNRYIVGN